MTTTQSRWLAPGEPGFLIGDTIYLRPHELPDVDYPAAWRESPLPVSPARAAEILQEEVPKLPARRTVRLVACRRRDDLPLGAATFMTETGLAADLSLHVDPALPSEAPVVYREMLAILAPWLTREKHYMIVSTILDETVPGLVDAALALGMRPGVRFREAYWRRGRRIDQVYYDVLHPEWVARLGDPGTGDAVATSPPVHPVASYRVSVPFTRAEVLANAVLVGPRVALRPMHPGDWDDAVRQLRQETETGFDRGRWLPSVIARAHATAEQAKADPPTGLELTVILRETGAIIGLVELLDIDHFHKTAETGSMLFSPQSRSQGYGTEAKNLLLEYAFEWLGLHMVRSYVWGPNTRSQAALRKQGYRDAGTFHWQSTAGTEFVDTRAFDLLASEWRERVGPPPA